MLTMIKKSQIQKERVPFYNEFLYHAGAILYT